MECLPDTQNAIIGLEDGSVGLSVGVPLPKLEDDMIMVKNVAAGLNPVDTKTTGALCSPGAIAGMDFSGRVVAMGPKAKASVPISVGDRVCGAVLGMHPSTSRVGAFAHYVGATSHVVLKIPDHMSFEEGASLGNVIGTIGLALFRYLQLPGDPLEPASNPRYVLVYGGSSATGTMAIQLVKLYVGVFPYLLFEELMMRDRSGLKSITTCSPRNFDLVKSYGAEHAFDYHSPTCATDIRVYTKNSLKYVLDCISEPETMRFCYECIGRLGGRYVALEPYPQGLHTRANVHPDWVLGPMMLGKPILWRPPFRREGDSEIREFAVKWFETAQTLLDEGKLKTHPIQTMEGGLQGVLDGIKLLQTKQISGKKLVYRLDG